MIITSMLDDDLYKFTMGQAVFEKFPHTQVEYTFINRGKIPLETNKDITDNLLEEIYELSDLRLRQTELQYLEDLGLFTPTYLDFLSKYRYDPSEVHLDTYDGFTLRIEGPWYRTIFWEVKLMAIISELNFKSYYPGLEKAVVRAGEKADLFNRTGVKFADFGTRRRYSAAHHDAVVNALAENGGSCFLGTSNIHLARKYNLKPIGTMAHEWIQAHSAIYGYRQANRMALRNWLDVFRGNLGIALPDTFTTEAFLQDFDLEFAKVFDGLRQDSGDPDVIAVKILNHFAKVLKLPIKNKTIIFSDSLTPDRVLGLHKRYKDTFNCIFGIGTNLTNDIDGVTPMNMVIKMTKCAPDGKTWQPVVKLSDSEGKHTGDEEEIEACKNALRLKETK